MIKKAVVVFVLFLLCSSIFAVAQETDSEGTVVEECGIGCKIWQFLFGSTEARAGRAWFDRSEALVGKAEALKSDGDKEYFFTSDGKAVHVREKDGSFVLYAVRVGYTDHIWY